MDKTRAQILGANLKRIRQLKGYSRKELADVIGITENSFGTYERGEKLPPLDKIFNLATFLEISIASLIGENDYNTEIPNIAAIVDKKIFEYRYIRAMGITSPDFYNPATELNDGKIKIYIPAKVLPQKDGVLAFCADESGNTGSYITFRDKTVFVDAVEKAEQFAVKNYIPFYQALKIITKEIIKK